MLHFLLKLLNINHTWLFLYLVLITKNNKKQGIYLPLKNIKGIILLNKKERKIKNEKNRKNNNNSFR